MTKTNTKTDVHSDTSKLVIKEHDIHLADVCQAILAEPKGRRSQAILSLAEQILANNHEALPIERSKVLALQSIGGLSNLTYLSKNSQRFPLLLSELNKCSGFKERSDRLKAIIEKPYLDALYSQLELGAKAMKGNPPPSPPSQAEIAAPSPQVMPKDVAAENFAFVKANPVATLQSKGNIQELAKNLLSIGRPGEPI